MEDKKEINGKTDETLRAYIIPYISNRKLAAGLHFSGIKVTGPILYVPKIGAIFFRSDIPRDADVRGWFTRGAQYLESEDESQDFALKQLDYQIRGKNWQGWNLSYKGSEFDLSDKLVEVEISKKEFENIANLAKKAYTLSREYDREANSLLSQLERKYTHELELDKPD